MKIHERDAAQAKLDALLGTAKPDDTPKPVPAVPISDFSSRE